MADIDVEFKCERLEETGGFWCALDDHIVRKIIKRQENINPADTPCFGCQTAFIQRVFALLNLGRAVAALQAEAEVLVIEVKMNSVSLTRPRHVIRCDMQKGADPAIGRQGMGRY
jgi:hypothetical protein